MKTNLKRMLAVLLLSALAACAPAVQAPPAQVAIPADPQEVLIWSSEAERPGWTINEPDTVDGIMSFVGLSNKYSTEKGGREDARRNAASAAVKYMGTLVKDKFEEVKTSFGLESDVIDPTAATNEFQKQMSVSMAKKIKVKRWYIEKWQTPTGTSHVVYALAHVPESAVNDNYKNTAKAMAKKAERQAKEAGDAVAQAQAMKAADFWKQMQERGVTE